MQLVHVRRVPFAPNRGQPPYEDLRHYLFNMGGDQLLAFFKYPKDVDRANRDYLGGMQGLAFNVEREALDTPVGHVRSCGVEVARPHSLGDQFWSAYFTTTTVSGSGWRPVLPPRTSASSARHDRPKTRPRSTDGSPKCHCSLKRSQSKFQGNAKANDLTLRRYRLWR